MMRSARFLAPILPALLIGAFSYVGGGARADTALTFLDAAAPRTLEIPRPHGRYVGWVVQGQEQLFADALLTRDGSIRIHIGGNYSVGTATIPDRWDQAAQFVGRLSVRDGVISASGRLFGEGCALPSPIRFCKTPARAKLKFQVDEDPSSSDRLLASMTVTSGSDLWIWQVVLDSWPVYNRSPVSLRWLRGLYLESTAEFSHYGETILDVGAAGRVYFQSPVTGCVGNGNMTPRMKSGVVDVSLRIENCEDRFAYLNGRYDGLSTLSQSDYWSYDAILRTWLAKPASAARPAAITMWSIPR